MQVLYWLIAVAILLLIEILTLGLTTIWFAGGALIAFFIALAGGSLYLQLIIFILVSFVLLLFTRPIALRYFNNNRAKTNLDALLGREGRVLEEINNAKGTGTIDINGQEWTARNDHQSTEEDTISAGEAVVITGISGVKVMVTRKIEVKQK